MDINEDLVIQDEAQVSNIKAERHEVYNRTVLKNKAYKELYTELPCKQKVQAQLKRLSKVLYKPFESLEY